MNNKFSALFREKATRFFKFLNLFQFFTNFPKLLSIVRTWSRDCPVITSSFAMPVRLTAINTFQE